MSKQIKFEEGDPSKVGYPYFEIAQPATPEPPQASAPSVQVVEPACPNDCEAGQCIAEANGQPYACPLKSIERTRLARKLLAMPDDPGADAPAGAAQAPALQAAIPAQQPAREWHSEGVPPAGSTCLVWVKPSYAKEPYYMVDNYGEQHEAPVSWSSATIPVGEGWDSWDHEDVLAWSLLDEAGPLASPHSTASHLPTDRREAMSVGWISVEDRLPAKHEEVLIAFQDISLPSTGQYTGSPRDMPGGWCYPAENAGTANDGSDPVVTHWMPLPAAPSAFPVELEQPALGDAADAAGLSAPLRSAAIPIATGEVRSAWQPIETAPSDTLVVVGYLDSEDQETPERHDFDWKEDGCWMQHHDRREHAEMVAPPGSTLPSERAPYTHWLAVPPIPGA